MCVCSEDPTLLHQSTILRLLYFVHTLQFYITFYVATAMSMLSFRPAENVTLR